MRQAQSNILWCCVSATSALCFSHGMFTGMLAGEDAVWHQSCSLICAMHLTMRFFLGRRKLSLVTFSVGGASLDILQRAQAAWNSMNPLYQHPDWAQAVGVSIGVQLGQLAKYD